MDFAHLRDLLGPLISELKDAGTHPQLPTICKKLGLPAPDPSGFKRDRMIASFNALPDPDLPRVAQNLLEQHPPSAATRNQIQDILWSDSAVASIPKRYRREVARGLNGEELFQDGRKFDELLESLWVLDSEDWMQEMFGGAPWGLRADIQQHVHRNPEDWPAEVLFDKLGAYEASDQRFTLFLEGLASSDIRPDEAAQRHFVALVNEALVPCAVELRESGTDGGYPVFDLVSLHVVNRERPKNLIFASPHKPDLRFRDALNNDIEIVKDAHEFLVYDRQIGNAGLTWSDLQTWWAETEQITDEKQAKRSLYKRLRASLPENSPPQVTLFDSFFEGFQKAVPRLPALLPEVWLHWDPKTVKERGPDALLRFRMDFLLLLPQGVRVVIEVDGKHHYANESGAADAKRYAEMVRADRDIKLAGYEVFRFGAADLLTPEAKADVKTFFEALFRRFRVPTI